MKIKQIEKQYKTKMERQKSTWNIGYLKYDSSGYLTALMIEMGSLCYWTLLINTLTKIN